MELLDLSGMEPQAIEVGESAYTVDEAALMTRHIRDEWRIVDYGEIMKLESGYTLDAYEDVCRFVGVMTRLFRDYGYAPDISFGKNYVFVALHTPEVRGLHKNDFILAAKIDLLLSE